MEQFEQLLTCAICLDRYRNPKLLPCQHSFCMEPCLEGLVDYVRRQVNRFFYIIMSNRRYYKNCRTYSRSTKIDLFRLFSVKVFLLYLNLNNFCHFDTSVTHFFCVKRIVNRTYSRSTILLYLNLYVSNS